MTETQISYVTIRLQNHYCQSCIFYYSCPCIQYVITGIATQGNIEHLLWHMNTVTWEV